MTYYPDDFLMELLFSTSTPEVQQVSSFWFTKLMPQLSFYSFWPCMAAAGGITIVIMVANKVARNNGKSNNKKKNNYSYFKFFETAKIFCKQAAFKQPFSSWFSKASEQNQNLSRRTPFAKGQHRATLRTAKPHQDQAQKDGSEWKAFVQDGKNGLKTTSEIKHVCKDDGVARRVRPQMNHTTSEETPRCLSTPEISSDHNLVWCAGEHPLKNPKTEPSRRLNDFKHKASVARLQGAKNAKIVWGATGPVEVDQFKGEMCIYPKKAEDSMLSSETVSEVICESGKKGRKEIVSDFRQQKAMFVQVNKSDKRIVIDTVTGTTSPVKTFSSKFTSAVNVDEATSDLILGNLKMISNKYTAENVLSVGDKRGENSSDPALPLVPIAQNQSPVAENEFLPSEGGDAPRPEPLSIDKSVPSPKEVKIDSEQKAGANEKAPQNPQYVDIATQMSDVHSSCTIPTEIVKPNRNDPGSNTCESLTQLVYRRMNKNKNEGLLTSLAADKLRGITEKKLFTNKSWFANADEIPPSAVSAKNQCEMDKPTQKENSRFNTVTLDQNNWKDLDSESTESYRRKILSDIEESKEKYPWSSETQEELNDTQSIFLESLSNDTEASVTFDTLFNVSEYSLRETFKNYRDFVMAWYRGEASNSGSLRDQATGCTSANDVSTRSQSQSSTSCNIDPGTYSLNSGDTVSWCKTGPSTEGTETPEDGYHHGFQNLQAATYGSKQLAIGMLEGKPPPGKPKMLQERNEMTKSKKGFKQVLDVTNENRLKTVQRPNDTLVFETYKGREFNDIDHFNLTEHGDGRIDDPSQAEHEACEINKTPGFKRGRCSPMSIFGSQLPRRIIPKDNLRHAGYSGYPDQMARVLKAEYQAGVNTSTRNMKPNICTCETKSLCKPFNSKPRHDDESLGTSTMEVFSCLINSADRLNTIYANSSRKHKAVGAIRHKLNNYKYRPYVIPKNQETERAPKHIRSKSLTEEKGYSKKSSFLGKSSMKFQRTQNTTHRYSLSSTFNSRSSKRSDVVLDKYGEKPLARRLNLIPKGAMPVPNVRLLHQRPLMPHNNINALPQTKVSSGPNTRISPTIAANEKRRRTNVFQSRKQTSQSPRELRINEGSGEFKRRVDDSDKAFVLKSDRAHKNLGNKTSFVAEMLSENLTITKNICMIESLRSESCVVDAESDSREKRDETESVTTPLPTQVDQNKVSTEVPTPTRSVTLQPHIEKQISFATLMKPHSNFPPLITPVKNETSRALSKMTFYGPEQLMNIQACPLRTVNYIFKDDTKDQPLPEAKHMSSVSPAHKRRSETDSLIYFAKNRSIAKNDELSMIWSPTVNITPLYSPARMKTNDTPQPESKVIGDHVQSVVQSEYHSDVSTQKQTSQPSIKFSTMPTEAKRLVSEARNVSRIPRYAPFQKPLKKSPNMPKEPPISPKKDLGMNRDDKTPLDLHRREELKRQQQANKTNMLLSLRRKRLRLTKKVNNQMSSNPSSKSPLSKLESPNQTNTFQKITVKNTEKGIQSVLPLLMNHTQDSIIIITPEKKVKHLNVIVNKKHGLSRNSNMLIQDSPDVGTNKKEFQCVVPESYEDIILDTGPETDTSQNTKKDLEVLQEMIHNTELNNTSGKKQEDVIYKGWDNQHVSGESPERNINVQISNLKTCKLRGTKNKDYDPHDVRVKNIAPSQKMASGFDVNEKEHDNTLTAKESVIQNECVKYYSRETNLVNKQSSILMEKKELLEKRNIRYSTRVNTPEVKATSSSIRASKIDRASDKSRALPWARKSRIPRSTKKTSVKPGKNFGEEANKSKQRADEQNYCESPIKVLTGEDYRIASIVSDVPEVELSKRKSQLEIMANNEAANKGHLLSTSIERTVGNAVRKRIPVLKMMPVAKRSRVEYIPEEPKEIQNSGKHNSINKKKSQKRERILEKKFTIKLDIAKPTVCYPVCGNNETQSLNDTISENLDFDFIKAEENYIKGHPGKNSGYSHGMIPDLNKSTKVSKDQSLLKGVTDNKSGQQKPLNPYPTNEKKGSAQESITIKKFKLKVDNCQQNLIDDDKTEMKTNKAVEVNGNKCSIDKQTDSLMKGMAPYAIPPKLSRETTPNEGKRTTLRRRKSTHESNDSFTVAPTTKKVHKGVAKKALHSQKSQHRKNVSVSSVRLRETSERKVELDVGSVDQEVNPENEQQLPRKSEKILDSQKLMFFSDQSPTKRVKRSRLDVQTKSSSRMGEPVSSVIKSVEKSPETRLDRGGGEGITGPHFEMVKLLRTNVAADSVKVPNNSSDMEYSTTMPTTEAEMRIGSKMEKRPPLNNKSSLRGAITAKSGAEDTRGSYDEVLKSDHVQGMLSHLRVEEREVLVKRLKDWIENRLSQTKNESDTSTEAIVGNELEHIFQVIISSLDTKALKIVYTKLQPKLENFAKIVEADERGAENSESQNVQKDRVPRLQSKAMNETENNRKSAALNKSARKIATKNRFQNFKIEQQPFPSRLPVRDSGLVSRAKPEVNGNLFQALVDMQRQKFVSHGHSPQSHPERRGPDFVTSNFRGKFDIRASKLSDTNYRSEKGSGNTASNNDNLQSPSSPTGILRNAFSSDLGHNQQVTQLKCKRPNGRFLEDSVYRHTRFPSVSSISCYDLGATYVASSKSPIPIQTASYVINTRKGTQDESLRSLPQDLILGSSGHSERWTPFSRGRLSDYMKELDLKNSYQALASRDHSQYDDGLFRCIASNSSAEVILSWLARTPDIDLSADRANKRDSTLKNMGSASAHFSSTLPLPLPTDDFFLTGEKGSPWPENLEQKSISPLNLTDLDSNLQVLTSLETKDGHNGRTVGSVKTGSVAKSIPALLVRDESATGNETSGEGKEKVSKRLKERNVSRTESPKNYIRERENGNEPRVPNGEKEANRKEQNESFNNRIGRAKMSRLRYVNKKRQIFNDGRQLAFIMPDSSTMRFARHDVLSVVESNHLNRLLVNEEQYLNPANPLGESLTTDFTDPSTESKQTFVHNKTLVRKGYRKGETIEEWAVQKKNGSQRDSNPNCLDAMLSWNKSPNGENSAQYERSTMSLDEHLNLNTSILATDSRSPGKGASKKWAKSEASTLSQVSFDWYKPSTVNPGQSSTATGQTLQIERLEDNEIENPESQLQEKKNQADVGLDAFQTCDGRDVSKCITITHNASRDMVDTENNKPSRTIDWRDEAEVSDYLRMANNRNCGEDKCLPMREENVCERKDDLGSGLGRYTKCKEMKQDINGLFLKGFTEDAIRAENTRSGQDEYQDECSQQSGQSCMIRNVSGESNTSLSNRTFDIAAGQKQKTEVQASNSSFGPERSLLTGDKSSMRSVISRYEYADVDRHVWFASSREKNRKCSLSFSSVRSHCEELKAENVSRSGYRYKTMNTGVHGVSTPGSAIFKRTHSHLKSSDDSYAEPVKSLRDTVCSYTKPLSTTAYFSNDRQSFDLCKSDGADAVADTRHPQARGTGRKYSMGFSYLFSENVDKGAGVDGCNKGAGAGSAAAAPRLDVVRTRRPKMNTMVGQIVKMFERRLQFRPVQN